MYYTWDMVKCPSGLTLASTGNVGLGLMKRYGLKKRSGKNTIRTNEQTNFKKRKKKIWKWLINWDYFRAHIILGQSNITKAKYQKYTKGDINWLKYGNFK